MPTAVKMSLFEALKVWRSAWRAVHRVPRGCEREQSPQVQFMTNYHDPKAQALANDFREVFADHVAQGHYVPSETGTCVQVPGDMEQRWHQTIATEAFAAAQKSRRPPERRYPMNLVSEALTLGWRIRRECVARGAMPSLKDIDANFGGSWHGELLLVPRDLLEQLSSEIATESQVRESEQKINSGDRRLGPFNSADDVIRGGPERRGLKLDDGKLELWSCFSMFGRALRALATHAQWGISIGNRGWGNQRMVEDGDIRYRNGLLRHILALLVNPDSRDEYGKSHWHAILWNVAEIVEREEIKREAQDQQGLVMRAQAMGAGIVGQNLSGCQLKNERVGDGLQGGSLKGT